MIVSKANNKSYDAFKKDLYGSINTEFDKLFTIAHLVNAHTDNSLNKTYITFEYVDGASVRKETISIPSSLFTVPEKK